MGIGTGVILSPYAGGSSLLWEVVSVVDLLQQPSHVLAGDLHGSQAFFVLLGLAFVPAESHVPVA